MDPRSCATIRELLPHYAANQLPPSERAAVERHVATCADCRAELREWLTLGDWLAQADAAIPPDTDAGNGLAAIHARLRQTTDSQTTAYGLDGLDGFERSALLTMRNQDYPTARDGALPPPNLHERRQLTGLSASAPTTPHQPQRRINPLLAGAAALVFIALAASLFYLLAPQIRPHNNIATQPTTGTWHVSASAPAHTIAMKFAPTALQTGYLCTATNPVPSPAPQWLYKTTDGGKTWRPLSVGSMPSVNQPASMSCDIFLNSSDANDVFAQLLLSRLEGSPQVLRATLWRSRDGGSTWRQVSLPQITNGWANLVVTGSRIVALAAYDQQVPPVCATDPSTLYPHQLDDLYATDNGGATWTRIGQSLISQGSSVIASGKLTSAGSTLFVQTYCAASQGSSSGDQYVNWKSTDGGATWSKAPLPSGAVYIQGFTHSTTGGYAGVAVEQRIEGSSSTSLPIVLYSADSGASWKALPPLSSMPGLHPVLKYTSVEWAIALPDGSVLAAVNVYDTGFAIKSSGIFAIDPHSATPTWRRYSSFESQLPLDISVTSQGSVLWALSNGGAPPAPIVYLSPLP